MVAQHPPSPCVLLNPSSHHHCSGVLIVRKSSLYSQCQSLTHQGRNSRARWPRRVRGSLERTPSMVVSAVWARPADASARRGGYGVSRHSRARRTPHSVPHVTALFHLTTSRIRSTRAGVTRHTRGDGVRSDPSANIAAPLTPKNMRRKLRSGEIES